MGMLLVCDETYFLRLNRLLVPRLSRGAADVMAENWFRFYSTGIGIDPIALLGSRVRQA
jgi:hypothetical protein